jgi:hypothetical protein
MMDSFGEFVLAGVGFRFPVVMAGRLQMKLLLLSRFNLGTNAVFLLP